MTTIRNTIKKSIGFAVKWLPKILRRKLTDGLYIFVFHEVSDHPSLFAKQFGLAVSIETFTRQIQWIKSNFSVIHPVDLLSTKTIPKQSAIISFDDGFLDSFENGLSILERMEVPSIMFLNMQAILEQKPLISATACFLDRYVPEFSDFSEKINISRPFHLTLTPSTLSAFEKAHGLIDIKAVIDYQGKFADLNIMKKWDGKNLVVFGNHLFNHWNAAALSLLELKEQYKKNELALSQFKNSVNLFAFTNGQPNTCFSSRDVSLLGQMGVGKVFSASGGVNRDPTKFLLRRMSLYERDKDEDYIWFQFGRAIFNDLLHKQSQW